jgi:predicted esterase YcpF (UPF0227 family)
VILYLHGFRSSPASVKARQLGADMAARGLAHRFACPALSPVPATAIAQAEALIATADSPVTVVGSSLGGYYATWLAERHDLQAVLINPAVVAHLSLADYLGPQSNLYTGEVFELTAEHIAQLKAMEIPAPAPQRYLLLVEEGDEVLDYRQAVARYAGARQVVLPAGDHSFTRFTDYIPTILAFAGEIPAPA